MNSFETYLEVTDENRSFLLQLGFDVEVGDELTCEVCYDVCSEDRAVGIMQAYADISSVECQGWDMERFFNLDHLTEDANCHLVEFLRVEEDRIAEERAAAREDLMEW